MPEKGKLYRINNYAVSDRAIWSPQNRELVAHHGYLWLWDGERDKNGDPVMTSVATGSAHMWLDYEVEAADA